MSLRSRHSFRLILAASLGGCTTPTGSNAPPLDVRGEYDVVWWVGYSRPDGPLSDPSLPHGECAGTVIMEQQRGGSMRGTMQIAGGAGFPCHTSDFPIVATAERDYVEGRGGDGAGGDFGWSLLLQSDVEPLLACTYRARAPGNSDGFRGVGRIDPQGRMSLAFGNIYECPSGRWRIIAGAHGRRRGT